MPASPANIKALRKRVSKAKSPREQARLQKQLEQAICMDAPYGYWEGQK